MKIDVSDPRCGTCQFGQRNQGKIDCRLWDHELQPDVVRFTDDLGPSGRPFNARCGLLILNSDPSSPIHTPGYWPTAIEQMRIHLRTLAKVFRQPLDGHRY